jgi:aminopeptidase-like protein
MALPALDVKATLHHRKRYLMSNPEGGRPTDYQEAYNDQAYKLCLLGATDKELANFFEVAESTINLWKTKHEQFSESIKKGKELADANVADRLYQRAMGFEHDSEELKVVSLGTGEGSHVERHKIRKIYAPDTTAAIFWLKNRSKKKWRDKQELKHTGNVNKHKELTDEELDARIKQHLERRQGA